jgi:type I restriction enzyme S subunit
MIEGLKPYAQSKLKPMVRTSAINVPWLTAIPAHWKVVRAKGLFTARTERARPDDEQLSATQAYGVIPQKEFERRVGRKVVQITQHLDKRAHVEPDDFVISMRSFQGGLERAWARGCIRSSYVVLKPSPETQVGYFSHLFKSLDYIRALQATGNFIRDGQDLNFNNFSLVDLPLPPPNEQADIAKCLTHANRKIDGFIRAKRKLIGLLNEQKQAIIHRAVTRGLHPDVPLKPSGIPWLGDIPQHWEVWPLKRIAHFKSGAGFPVTEQGKKDLEVPFLKVSDMTRPGNEVWIESSNNTVSRDDAERLGAFVFPAGSIIFPKVGGAMLTNKRRLLKHPSCIDNNVMGCVVRRGHLDFVFLLLQQLDFGRLSKPGPVPAIGEGEVREIKVVFPPLDEQKAIVPAVEKETAPLTTAIARTEREIALMQEYRTRLTADLVTGKLDVREAAAKLPEPPAEPAAEEVLGEELLEEAEPEETS